MGAYSDLASAAGNARATLASVAGIHGWPAADTAAILADVEAAEAEADGWFTSDQDEAAAFWLALHDRYSYWNGGLANMDKIGAWLGAAGDAGIAASVEADLGSSSTIVIGGLAGTVEDLGTVAKTAGEIGASKTTWYAIAAVAVAFLAWKVSR